MLSGENNKSGEPGAAANAKRPKTNVKKCRLEHCAAPSDTESETEVAIQPESDEEVEQPSSGDEAIDRMSRAARESLRDEANSFHHLFTHKPNPYCEACLRAQMKRMNRIIRPIN